ncbi:hypothetical protein L5220_10755 [Synechococcus sp. PCC 6716]|nr:hypothetical protein [Synechococcus sp. PCC 6716]
MIQPPRWRSLPVILFITGIAFLGSSALSVMAAPRGRGRPAGNPPRGPVDVTPAAPRNSPRGPVDLTPRGGVDVTPAAPRYRYNNAIVNPRWNPGLGNWWWNGSRPWYPNRVYWGGGFWGSIVAGAVAGSAAAEESEPTVVVTSLGGQLLSSYSLVQVPCHSTNTANLVVIRGPEGSVICAQPTATVPSGVYIVDPETLSLVPQ